MPSAACPTQPELLHFALGDLPAEQFTALARHVESCPACESALQAFDGLTDPLGAKLRQLGVGAPADTPLEPVPDEVFLAAQAALGRPADSQLLTELRRLGKFELLEELGAGSYGNVFRARDTELDRLVAIKLLRAGRLASRAEIDRFLREARSAAQLKHAGIVSLYEIGQHADESWYLVEEFIEGATLANQMASSRIAPRQAAELIAQIADALAYAHAHGVVHRDIKPSNIMLDLEGRPHLMDFGLAKRDVDDEPMTPDGEVLGTPAYMSPEQARGDSRQIDARSDLYSLGVVLYELLTGERPFHGNRRMLVLLVLEDEPRAPRRLNDKIPRDLETICLKAMAKAPARRYATAREFADDLRRFLRGDAILARPMGLAEKLKHWRRRNPVAAGLLAAVTLGSAYGMWHLSNLSAQLVRSSALDSAAQVSEMLVIVNEDYSRIVDRLYPQKILVTHDYAAKPGAIPLPATMTIDLGNHISEKSASGMRVRLYSDHPFRPRTDGGPRDVFEREALDKLLANPDEPFWSFEDVEDRPSLRYATARRMDQTCVRCHNGHPDSPKKDWKVGDVPGVLEVIRPLDRDVARARQGLHGTLVVMGVIGGSLLAATGVSLVVGNRRKNAVTSEQKRD